MSKRKREDAFENDAPSSIRQKRVQHHIDLGTRKLAHALKVAKGFERQKLGRRQKTAVTEHNEKDEERIKAEIAALKTLDQASSAQQHLYKNLLKIKAAAESANLPPGVHVPHRKIEDAASLNVTARLLNSNPVKDAMPAILEDVQRAMGIEIDRAALPKKRLRKKDFEDMQITGSRTDKSTITNAYALNGRKQTTENSDSMEGDGRSVDFGTIPSDSEDRFEGFDPRLASSDNGDSDQDVEELERQLEREGFSHGSSKRSGKQDYDYTAELSMSADELDDASISPEPRKAARTVDAPSNPNFLPSLSLGGYISGGSDSDIEDIESVAPKKNRRGQRERQKIWEKKYGSKAKHLKHEPKSDRNSGWDAKRGATDNNGRRHNRNEKFRAGGRGTKGEQSATGANDAPVKERKRKNDNEGPLHPSWQAKKLAKEKANAPAKFEGKKITFD